MSRSIVTLGALMIVAIAVSLFAGVQIGHAWTPDHTISSTVCIYDPVLPGFPNATKMRLDVTGPTHEQVGESYLFIASEQTEPDQAALVYRTEDQQSPKQAELVVSKDATADKGRAWMKSTSGAKVEVDTNGDIVFTLGTP